MYSKNVVTITKTLAEALADTLAEDQVETLSEKPCRDPRDFTHI